MTSGTPSVTIKTMSRDTTRGLGRFREGLARWLQYQASQCYVTEMDGIYERTQIHVLSGHSPPETLHWACCDLAGRVGDLFAAIADVIYMDTGYARPTRGELKDAIYRIVSDA